MSTSTISSASTISVSPFPSPMKPEELLELVITAGLITDQTTRGPAASIEEVNEEEEMSNSPRPPIPNWSYPTTKENSPELKYIENERPIPILAPQAQRSIKRAVKGMEKKIKELIRVDWESISPESQKYADMTLDELNEDLKEQEAKEEEKKEKGKGKETTNLEWPSTEDHWPIQTDADWTPAGLSTTSPRPDCTGVHLSVLEPERNWNGPIRDDGWPIPINEATWGTQYPEALSLNFDEISFPAHRPTEPFRPDNVEPPIPYFCDAIASQHLMQNTPFRPIYWGGHIPISLHVMVTEPNCRPEVVRALRTIRDTGLSSDLHRYERLVRDIAGANKKIRDYEMYK